MLPELPLTSPGMCAIADADLLWLHLLSDLAIAAAYLSIPAALIVLMLRRRDLAYPWLVGLFAVFIVACGVTHLMHAIGIFRPAPELAGLIKAATAAVSLVTAVVLWPVLPRLLALRSPAALAREVEVRRAAEARAIESEARARESEARTGAFIANLAEALFVVQVLPDGELRLETVNPAFERLFGVPSAVATSGPPERVLPATLVAEALPRWRQAASHGETLEYEISAELPMGRLTWQTVLVPMRRADGTVESLLGSARDVTATRRLQAGLVQSARLATIGTMCAGLAHEASQPLNTAFLWLRRVRAVGAQLAEEQQAALARSVAVVEQQLRRAGDLVTRIRALAGGEAEAVENFDVAVPVAAAVRFAASQYAGDGIAVALDRQRAEPLTVQGSAGRLEQAVMQLLANARDAVLERRATEPGASARVEVTLGIEAGRVVLEVCDTGRGIAPEVRDAIFDPFFTTKEPGRGIGLGLPFAASVARAMGGSISGWNRPDGGACFRMELAAAEAPSGGLSPALATA